MCRGHVYNNVGEAGEKDITRKPKGLVLFLADLGNFGEILLFDLW